VSSELEGATLSGAATYIEQALNSVINLFVCPLRARFMSDG
jgi:hypothetical protein